VRVLLVHKFFGVTGGAEVFFHEVGRVLQENGHEVGYFSTDNLDDADSDRVYPQKNVWFGEDADYLGGSALQRARQFPSMVYSRKNRRSFAQVLEEFKPDIVHAFAIYITITPSVLDACRAAGVPVVMSCNDYKLVCPNYKMYHHGNICEACQGKKFYQATLKRCAKDSLSFSAASTVEAYFHRVRGTYRKGVHTFCFASEFMARKTLEFWGENSINWRILRNPFDAQASQAHPETRDYLLYFGRLIEEKGVDRLVRAMAQVPQARLVIVGDGPDAGALADLARQLDLTNVEFVGPKWGDELDELLDFSRAVVVPSVWHENFPYVILQAFARGKAVIGTEAGGIPELVRHEEFGFVYPPDDVARLAALLGRAWDEPEATREMGLAAKRWVDDQFNDERFYQSVMEIYQEVVPCTP